MIGLPIFRGALSGFSPLSLGPALWLSDTGSNAGQWDDLSGNGRHATQANDAFRPAIVSGAMNGRQVRRFSGATSFLSVSDRAILRNCPGATVFAVFSLSSVAAGAKLFFSCSTGTAGLWLINVGSNGAQFVYAGRRLATDVNVSTLFGSASLNVPYIYSATYNYAAATRSARTSNGGSHVDPAFQTPGNSENLNAGDDPSIGRLTNGTGGQFAGDVAEIIVLPYAATTAQRQSVERYFSLKYNITLT